MAEVKKKVTLDPGATWADVEKSIDKTARDLGIARGETAALAATAAQAGVAYKDLEGFVRLAAKASKGWDMAPREASERLAKIKTMTGWTLPQIEEFADKVNELGDKGATTERALVEMFERSAASAKAANVPLDTSLAVTAALNSIGMQEEVAARFWNAFSSKLRTAAEGGRGAEQAAEGYKQLGLTVEEVEQGMKTNATRTILDILERLEKSADKASIAVKLFGQEWWDEAARSGQALPEIRKNLDLLASGSWKDSLGRNLQIELDTTISRLERVSAIVSEIGDKFMRWSLGPINEQLDRLIKAWDTTKTTGFLAGAGGGPIEKLKEKTPLPFSEKNRRLFLDNVPKGESVDAYEKRHGLDRAPPSSGSGANLRDEIVSASRRHGIDPRIMFGIHAGESLHGSRYDVKHDAMESSWGPFQLNRRGGLGNQFERDTGLDVRDPRTIPRQVDWVARFIGRGGRLSHWRGYHGNRDWNPSWGNAGLRPVHPTLTGAPPAPAAPPAAAPAAPGKQSRLHRGVTIQTAHFHGVKDVAALHRRLASLASRRVVAARDNALHDVS
jgi:TP901 family phage tail tape measure protein